MRHFITFRGLDDGNDIRLDVSAICNSQNTSVTDARCTRNLTSASSQASFTVGYTPDKVTDPYDGSVIDREALYGQVVQYVLTAVERKAEMHVEILDDTRTSVIFTGMVDPTDISITRGYIPRSISLSCRDYTTDLDRKPGRNLVFNNKSVNEIVNTLLDMVYGAEGGHNGIGDGLMHTGVYDALSDLPDTRTVEYFVITADESTTNRKVIDTLLLEAGPGHVLHYVHSTNRFEIVRSVPSAADGTQLRTVAYRTGEGIQARTGVYKYDGILLKWPSVEVRESDNVYAQEIELKYSQDGGVTGALLANGAYYPADGDITPTRQDYRKGDYDYVTGVSRSQNSDLGLLYATDAELGILAEPVPMRDRGTVADMDALAALQNPRAGDYAKVTDIDEYRAYDGSSWVWTHAPSLSSDGKGNVYHARGEVTTFALLPSTASEGDFYKCRDTGITWCRMDGEWQRKISLFLFPVLETTDVSMTDGNPAFYPRSMWALGRNRSGGMVNLLTLSVTATSVARTKVNSTTHPAVLKEPEEYSATYIFDTDKAESFALWLYNAHRIACTTVTWNEWEDQRTQRSVLGECVNVEFMPGRKAVFCVIQIDDTGITRLKRGYKVTALLVSGFESAFSGTHEITLPSAGSSRQAVQAVYSYAVSSSGSVTPTSWSDVRNPEQGKYLWTRTVTYYSDGTSEITYSSIYIPRDGEDADLTGYSYEVEYGLSDSPSVFHFPTATLGYQNNADTGNLGYEDDDYGFDDVASWSGSYSSWYRGLYVWQRMKVTDRDGNVAYTDPTYCKELTESLEQSCDLQVSTNPETYTYNARRTDYQYLPLLVRSIGMKGTLTLSCDLGVFSTYDPQTGLYTDVGQTVQVQINGGTADVSQYYVKIAYTLRNDVTVTASLLQWTSDEVVTELVIPYMQAKTSTVQLTTVPAYADLPSSLNLTDSQKDDIVTGNNLIYGDYILSKYITLTPDDADTASDETGALHSFGEFGSYYTRSGDTFTLAQISSFVIGTTYYAFRMYPWKFNGAVWERTDDSAIKVDTVNEIVNLAKSQKTAFPDADVDYHECLYAYEAFIQNLTVSILNVGDVFANNIQSNGYQEDNDGTPVSGYRLEYKGGATQQGLIKSVGGLFADMNVRGALKLWKDDTETVGADIEHPALTTVSEAMAGDPTGVTVNTSPVAWSGSSLLNAVDNMTRDSVVSASGSFGSLSLNWCTYATNLNTVLQSAYSETCGPATQYSYGYRAVTSTTITIPSYVRGNISFSVSGETSYLYKRYAGYLSGRVTAVKNGVTTVIAERISKSYAISPITFNYSTTLTGGDSIYIKIDETAFNTSSDISYLTAGHFTMNLSQIRLSDFVSDTGFWLNFTDGSQMLIPSNGIYTDALSMSAPVSFNSNNYLTLRDCSAFINYRTFVDAQGITRTLTNGRTYDITSANLQVNGSSATGVMFTRLTNSVILYYKLNSSTVYSIELVSSEYYNVMGTIKVAETNTIGVKMMGNYPKRDADDPQGGFDCGNSAYAWRNGYFKTIHYQNVGGGSARVLKENIVPFTKSALDIIMATKIVNYNYKKDVDKRQKIGFIADDTPAELAGQGHDRMELDHCVAVLIKAVQELEQEIERLKERDR